MPAAFLRPLAALLTTLSPCHLGWSQGKHNVLQMQQIVTAQRSAMRLVVASLRSPADLALLASQVRTFSCLTSCLFSFSPQPV